MAAEYIMAEGNHNVILCERGIRTFETATRNTLDLNAVPVLKKLHAPAGHRRSQPRHRPLGVRGPHGQGRHRRGADGLMIEVHTRPGERRERRRPVAEARRLPPAHARKAAGALRPGRGSAAEELAQVPGRREAWPSLGPVRPAASASRLMGAGAAGRSIPRPGTVLRPATGGP